MVTRLFLLSLVAFVFPLTCHGFGLAPLPIGQRTLHRSAASSPLFQSKDTEETDSRRAFFTSVASNVAGMSLASAWLPKDAFAASDKMLVLGGTGFVGSQIVSKLQSLGVTVVATSRNGRDGTTAFDVMTAGNVASEVEKLASGCTAVISTIGAINSKNDGPVNAASGLAANGAKAAGVKRFVYISVSPEVREATKGVGFLEDYMKGKTFSEESIKYNFGEGGTSYTIIEPTFIYGGDSFSLNPPRVTGGYGKLIEGLLSSGLFRSAAGLSQGSLVGVALQPPVPVEAVAGAAVAGALGKSASILDTYDKINEAANLV